MNLSDSSGVSLEDSGGKQKISTSWSSPSGLEQKPKVWASMTDTPEASSVVQRASPESAVRMGNVLTEHLSFLGLSSADDRNCRDNSEKNCAAFADFPAELDGIGCDSPSTYPCSSHATDAIEEVRCSREIHNTLTIGSRCGSTELSSLTNSPSPDHSDGGSTRRTGQHLVGAFNPTESTEQPRRTDNDVPSRQHDQPGSHAVPKAPSQRAVADQWKMRSCNEQ
jgi:hypothetical protein